MMTKLAIAASVALLGASSAAAQDTLMTRRFTTASGAGVSSGSGFRHRASVGLSACGRASDGTYESRIGFLHPTSAGGGCSCPCHGDPQCDSVTNVLDVVQAVNVAFKGWLPVLDSDCPQERTDVDCSGATNVLDVVRFVNVAFKGMSSTTQFCDPCPEPVLPMFIRGDADCDGDVDLADRDFLIDMLFSTGPQPPCRDAADADDNGSLNIGDVTSLTGFLESGGIPPEPPFPNCGVDPTPDGLTCNQNCCGP